MSPRPLTGNPVDVPQGIDPGGGDIRPVPSLVYTVPSRVVPLLRPNQISPGARSG